MIVLAVCLYLLWPKAGNQDGPNSANLVGEESLPAKAPLNLKPQEDTTKTFALQKGETSKLSEAPASQPLSEEKVKELRSMAKLQLASSYSAFKAFYVEYNRYTTDLKSAGWWPSTPVMGYRMGFVQPFYPGEGLVINEDLKEDPRALENDILINQKDEIGQTTYSFDTNAEKLRLQDYAHLCEKGCSATEEEFEVLLVLPLGDTGKTDVWTINEKKELKLVLDGTK